MRLNSKILFGILFTFFYFLLHLFIIKDYGISWDFHYHHFGGLSHLGQKVPAINDPYPIPFTPPDPRAVTNDPFGPFTQIIPTISYLIFYQQLHLLPFDSAYNFPSVIFGSFGILVLFLFLYESISFPVALFTAIFLALLPTHFGYLHNDMKDVPNAFAFTLAIYLFWRLVKYQRKKDLFWAILTFAFAFNVKINSVMVPAVCLAWFLFKERKTIINFGKHKLIILYFALAPLTALFVWWPFWKDPIGKLLELPYYFTHNTLNMPVLFLGKTFRSGINIPWDYPWIYIFITTPIGILFSFLAGLVISLSKLFKRNSVYGLILFWLFIPLARFLIPNVSAIDGMRHFMEIIYPLSALAGIGFYSIFDYLRKITKIKYLGLVIFTFMVVILIYNLIKFHPYQTSFYNALAGGVGGAEGKFDIDFWGASQKDAMLWLNKNVQYGSFIHVVMAQSSAAMYGRNDLQERINKKAWQDSDYTVVLNKRSFFTIYPVEKYLSKSLNENKLVYKKTIDGVPLFWVIKNL